MRFDLALLHLVNGLSGNWALDHILGYEENSHLLRSGIFLAAYWWFWFAGEGEKRRSNQRIIIAAIVGAIVALMLNRAISSFLPFRVRPMWVPGIGFHMPSFGVGMDMENWSSFPSDHATFWFALSFGLFRLYRPLGVVCMIYSTGMCLARLYFGMHYPSDLLAGAALGTIVVWATGKAFAVSSQSWIGLCVQRSLCWLHRLEQAKPEVFFAAAFLASFELSMMFGDIRNGVRGVLRLLQVVGFSDASEVAALFVLGGCVVVITATATLVSVRRRLRRRALREV